jgi:hypothetical protein
MEKTITAGLSPPKDANGPIKNEIQQKNKTKCEGSKDYAFLQKSPPPLSHTQTIYVQA